MPIRKRQRLLRPSTLRTGLVTYLQLEEASGTRVDSTGRGNDVAPTSGTPGNAAGMVGNAASFVSASSQALGRASTSDLSMGDISFTISVVMKLTSVAVQRYVYSKWSNTASSNEEYSLLYESSGTRFDFYVAGFGKRVRSDVLGAPSTGVFYHIVCGHDSVNDLIFMYVNGVYQGSAATAGSFPALNSQTFGVGSGKGDGFSGGMDGIVDDLKIWKRMLTPGEILEDYANVLAGRALR